MSTFTQHEIDELIKCPKVITSAPRRTWKMERGYRRNDMELQSQDGKYSFGVFMRVDEEFRENFSIGLTYRPKGERDRISLLRCNGPHGSFIGESESDTSSHFSYHVHRAKAENIEAGVRAESGGEITAEYGSYDQALRYFLRRIEIVNANDHFPNIGQTTLWE